MSSLFSLFIVGACCYCLGFFVRFTLDATDTTYRITKTIEEREYNEGIFPTYYVRIKSAGKVLYEQHCSVGFINETIIKEMSEKADSMLSKLNSIQTEN